MSPWRLERAPIDSAQRPGGARDHWGSRLRTGVGLLAIVGGLEHKQSGCPADSG